MSVIQIGGDSCCPSSETALVADELTQVDGARYGIGAGAPEGKAALYNEAE